MTTQLKTTLTKTILALFMVLSLVGLVFFIADSAYKKGALSVANKESATFKELQIQVKIAKQSLLKIRRNMENNLNALALQAGKQQAQIFRLEALGKRLSSIGQLDPQEFNFLAEPAIGGTFSETNESHTKKELNHIFELKKQLDEREVQLDILEQVLIKNKLKKTILPSGSPVLQGYISSKYGRRPDPKTGRSAIHHGIDFAKPKGSPIIAVASGIVTRSGKASGYGNLIEIRHPDGYSTRYGHNQKNLVKVGDLVHKNQVIGYVGSTGRSTGPHVHFEVRKEGKPVNPARYLR